MPWIDSLFKRMVELDASDLHMTSTRKPMFRIHGDMVEVAECPELQAEQMLQVLYDITPERNKKQFEAGGDTDFAYEIEGVARYRCNLFRDHRGPGGVFRLIPSEVLTVQQLNLPQAVLDLCFLSKGLVVVTGPTGSGKSTTLAAMVDHVNKNRSDHVITIEDPIEFLHKDQRCLMNQREVGRHTDSFKVALRAALREDPDIILVGEMRDLETIEIAIETAETGHLVFGTLHTTTAPSTVDRIIDQFPADRQAQIRTMLATSLKGVIAQTLCKKIEGGRTAALEIMIVNNAISSQIREAKTHQIVNAMQMGGKLGMRLLNDSLAELVAKKKVDPKEAYIKAVDKAGFMAKLNELGVQLDLTKLGEASESAPATAPMGAPMQDVGGAPAVQNATVEAPAAPLPSQEPEAAAPPVAPAPETAGSARSYDPFEAFKKDRKN
ncbi:MAG: type IV pilus twitching motility protein PilT [Planctomycetota bacterium]|nr:MAG: type IV pilus twitching motility protein PilT [Planctomycetota bacterium]